MADKRVIDLYPYKIVEEEPFFLLLKRSKGHIYYGQWRMIGGKVESGETYWQAAVRELFEETELKPLKLWTIPSINSFYEHGTDQILHIPAFAADISVSEKVNLNSEHSGYDWFSLEDAISRISWPEQKRLIQLTYSLITSNQILEDWYIDIH